MGKTSCTKKVVKLTRSGFLSKCPKDLRPLKNPENIVIKKQISALIAVNDKIGK